MSTLSRVLVLYSQRHTYLTLGSVTEKKKKGKKEKTSFFLFNRFVILDETTQTNGVFCPSIFFSNTNSTHTYLCLWSPVPRQGTHSHCQKYWFSTLGLPGG
jgi:hypothetical protein